ncbi:MAG: hypothetical protein DRI90_28880 [Deltaproteobacteria bacterium]|nr:MAG: hypothetical protein DRI90_28880 [Deltaproteobacteria bacterium]
MDRRDETRVDPLLPTGIVATSVGAFMALGGALLLGSDDGDVLCGTAGGCVTRPDRSRELAGGALVGAGLGLAAVGLPSLIAGVGEIPREGHRHSHGMTSAGVALTTLAGGLLGSGLGILLADAGRGELDEPEIFVPLLAVGGTFALGGVPLWIFGAQRPATGGASEAPSPRPAEPSLPPAPGAKPQPTPSAPEQPAAARPPGPFGGDDG